MKTQSLKHTEIDREWYVVDATDQTVGRLATRIAQVLIGKHKASFARHVNAGDFVVVINADKVQFTGRKWTQKQYMRHSGYPGGLKTITAAAQLRKNPAHILETAVRGMLPKNRLRDIRMTHLKVYARPSHPHLAQQPKPFPSL